MIYPLKFKPIYKKRIWGGDKLHTVLSKKRMPLGSVIGESWELSGFTGGASGISGSGAAGVSTDCSIVANGTLKGNSLAELIEIYMGDLVGEAVYEKFGLEFPLLIKFIDAAQNLSIQVHPNDDVAMERHNAYGKTEMWYIMDREPGAQILLGFQHDTSKTDYNAAIEGNYLDKLLTHFDVQANQAYFIPAGAVHAICQGVLLAEIQQTSDITYRVYDWGRLDDKGIARELHTDLAMDVIDFSAHPDSYYLLEASSSDTTPSSLSSATSTAHTCQLKQSPYFDTAVTILTNPSDSLVRDYSLLDSFVIYICVEGSLTIQAPSCPTETLARGEVMLIPAALNSVTISGAGRILETWIP